MATKTGAKTGGGSRKGIPNKNTSEIKSLAQVYGPAAIARLAVLSGLTNDPQTKKLAAADSETAQIAALKELLDRGYGKARQPLDHGVDGSLEDLLARLAP
jgi:hypothetical protein